MSSLPEPIDTELIFAMANVGPDLSGTGVRLYFARNEWPTANAEPVFRLGLGDSRWVTVSVNSMKRPKNVKGTSWQKVLAFVWVNRDLILRFWNSELTDPSFLTELQKVN